jgi:hypothetical protein
MSPIMKTILTILKAVAFGMGVAVLVLLIMDVLPLETAVLMLSIGLVAVALGSLQSAK